MTAAHGALDSYIDEDNMLNREGIEWTEIPALSSRLRQLADNKFTEMCDKSEKKLNEIERMIKAKDAVYSVSAEERKLFSRSIAKDLEQLVKLFNIIDETFMNIRMDLYTTDEDKASSDIRRMRFSKCSEVSELREARWNTYRACMKRDGVWREYEVNFGIANQCFESQLDKQYKVFILQIKTALQDMFLRGHKLVDELQEHGTNQIMTEFKEEARVTLIETILYPLYDTVRDRLRQHETECFERLSKFDKDGVQRFSDMIRVGLKQSYRAAASNFNGVGSHVLRVAFFEKEVDEKVAKVYETSYRSCIENATDRLKSEIDVRRTILELIRHNQSYLI